MVVLLCKAVLHCAWVYAFHTSISSEILGKGVRTQKRLPCTAVQLYRATGVGLL